MLNRLNLLLVVVSASQAWAGTVITSGSMQNNCYVPQLDEDLCSTLYSVCRTSPQKLCLAQSAMQCLPDLGMPVSVAKSIERYLIEIITVITRPPAVSTTVQPVTIPPSTSTTLSPKINWKYPINPDPVPGIIHFPGGITVQTGNIYLDGLISVLSLINEVQIQQILELMMAQMQVVASPADFEAQLPYLQTLTESLDTLIQIFSISEVNTATIEYYVRNLLYTNPELFQWLVTVVEQIFENLAITKVVYPEQITTIDAYYIVFETTYSERQDLYFCHGEPNPVLCERYCTDTYGGNWITIQARERQNPDAGLFDTTLDNYRKGFGDLQKGYFMGLDCLNSITTSGRHELLVELTDASGATALAHYESIVVGGPESNYELHLGKHKGGWWYDNCVKSSVKNFLNGYFSSNAEGDDRIEKFPFFGVRWSTLQTPYVLVATRMFIRQAENQQFIFASGDVRDRTQLEPRSPEVHFVCNCACRGLRVASCLPVETLELYGQQLTERLL
ncbi:hypothetical protein HAZT_HAZT007508 [Hyalella azteca]|uniref:Fibrinogen C-terminal domain-containing protein n=1 Tax=Hyalella azteca TaxID=294128 RepID=A0A6A0HEG1_HYAAZ|nr:hypothetical protein HAZT_HAZT007508 [Hyalella azteca]